MKREDHDALVLARELIKRPMVVFDPEVHVQIVERCFVIGMHLEEVAQVLGIGLDLLSSWIEVYPELQAAKSEALRATSNVAHSLYQMAVGFTDASGRYRAPNVIAAIFWMKAQAAWSDNPPAKKPDKVPHDMSFEEFIKHVSSLSDMLDSKRRAIDVTVDDGPARDEPEDSSE